MPQPVGGGGASGLPYAASPAGIGFEVRIIHSVLRPLLWVANCMSNVSVYFRCSLYLIVSFRASPVSHIVDPCSSWSPSSSFACQSSFYCSQQSIIMS